LELLDYEWLFQILLLVETLVGVRRVNEQNRGHGKSNHHDGIMETFQRD
jgi:hypothetical protein